MYTANQIMRKDVVSIPEDATVEQAMRELLTHDISGAPVIDKDGNLVGIVSEFPLMEAIYDPGLKAAPVSQLMTKDVLTVSESTMLSDVASIFVAHRIRRVPVLRKGLLVGLVSRPDLLRYILEAGDEIAEFVETAKSVAG